MKGLPLNIGASFYFFETFWKKVQSNGKWRKRGENCGCRPTTKAIT